MLHSTHELTINKLILLYMLKTINAPVPQSKITEFILYKEYTDYFSLQQYFSELVNANLVNIKNENHLTLYTINTKGKDTLELFKNRIPYSIREEIKDFAKDKELSVDIYTSITSDIEKVTETQWRINCSMSENNKLLIETKFLATSEDDAKRIKSNWLKKAKNIYKTIKDDVIK